MVDTSPIMDENTTIGVFRDAVRKRDSGIWNRWRIDHDVRHPNLRQADFEDVDIAQVNLMGANLSGACLINAKLSGSLAYSVLDGADLSGAEMACHFEETQLVGAWALGTNFCRSRIEACNFRHAHLQKANFEGCYLEDTYFDHADLTGSSFYQADLWMAFLRNAVLDHVNLRGANLHGANLAGATIRECDLQRTVLVDSNIEGASISDCDIYGISAWNLARNAATVQSNLRVSRHDESPLYVDDIEVAQFIHLMVNNQRIRDVIDTVSRKAVLILGRFTPERKAILNGIRDQLRKSGYVPIIFDFEKPAQRDFEETVKVLAGLSRFVIVDITNPSSSPLEINATVPDYMIPFVPIIQSGEKEFSMFKGLQSKFHWLLPTVEYPSAEALMRSLDDYVIGPALGMETRIAREREAEPPRRTIPA
jgi:uncharacterized protein YjbI with pentapeptide repeats